MPSSKGHLKHALTKARLGQPERVDFRVADGTRWVAIDNQDHFAILQLCEM